MVDSKTSTAALLLMAAGVFYRGAGQGAPAASPAAAGSPAASAAASAEGGSGERGPWTPVCNYVQSRTVPEADQTQVVQVDVQGAGNTRNLRLSLGPNQPAEEPPPRTQFCLEGGKWNVKTLIASVPNPELTHLSLTFDRYIESLTRALSDGDLGRERYSFDSYWFPWHANVKEETESEKRKTAEKDRDKRFATPGLLLFRRSSSPDLPTPDHDLLLVFLISETPTSGLNHAAFHRAWTYARDLASGPEGLPICGAGKQCAGFVGPSFTGSLPSLRLLLEEEQPTTPVFAISGAVTGEGPKPLGSASEHFCTTVETDENSRARLYDFLRSLATWPVWNSLAEVPSHFAMLVEDETAYGESAAREEEPHSTPAAAWKPVTLRFPRGIAQLRNAAQELPGASALPQAAVPSYSALPLNLRDTGQDTILSFSQQQTPVSQEAVLIELAATLRREQIRYAGITATDPLDTIFLARALHALAPNLRIVISNPDLLFARAAQNWGLSGVLAVTSYPLILRNQHFRGSLQPSRTQFASMDAEGEYNACRRMLLAAAEPRKDTEAQGKGPDPACSAAGQAPNGEARGNDYLLDYAAPGSDGDHRPPVWLTLLGRNEWWPVASYSVDPKLGSPVLEGPTPGAANAMPVWAEKHPSIWHVFFVLVCVASALHVIFLFGMNKETKPYPGWWRFAFLRRLAWDYHPGLVRSRRVVLTASCLTVASACGALAAAVFASRLVSWEGCLPAVIGIAAVGEAVWAARGIAATSRGRFWAAAVTGVFGLGVLAAGAVAALRDGQGHTGQFAAYRALHIESGISPLPPIFFLLMAIYLFCWLRLYRLRIEEERKATRPPWGDGGDAVPTIGPWQWWLVGGSVLAWLVFFRPPSSLATVEGQFYDLLLTGLSSVVVFLFTLVLVRFCAVWRILHKSLQKLEQHPLRYAFSRLPKAFSWAMVWTGDWRPPMTIPNRCLDVLRLIPQAGAGQQASLIHSTIQKLQNTSLSFSEVPGLCAQLNEAFDEAYSIVWSSLESFWKQGVSDTVASRANPAEKTDGVPEAWNDDPGAIAAEEFLALRHVNYILYAIRMMRGFLEYLVWGFILLAIALAAYPFEGQRHIEFALVCIFLVAGAGIAVVFAQMDRDPLLSRLSETNPNQLGRNFVVRVASAGALPLVTLLASQVPGVGNFLLSWLQPALDALK